MKRIEEQDRFSVRVKEIIKRIPKGKAATYGQIAAMAGNYRAARQVAWVLHSSPGKDKLPWHRVINRKGEISLAPGNGFERQKELLENEGVILDSENRIDLERFLWKPDTKFCFGREGITNAAKSTKVHQEQEVSIKQ